MTLKNVEDIISILGKMETISIRPSPEDAEVNRIMKVNQI